MLTNKLFIVCLMLLINFSLHAELIYEQDLTIGSWKSQDDVQNKVRDFCNAACGDPDIKVVDVKYSKKVDGDITYYSAKILCHVSEVDKDLIRIQGKVFRQQHQQQAQ